MCSELERKKQKDLQLVMDDIADCVIHFIIVV